MRTESGAEKRDEALKFISAMLVALACGFFLAVMQPLSKSAPYSDDWSFIGAAGLGPEGVLRWSLQPHNEHFIPIMKLVQYAVLRVALFDFRPLIAINAMVAAAASVAAFYVARAYRGGRASLATYSSLSCC